MEVKSVYWLKEGNSRMVSLEVKDVVSAALRGGTESVVLCHNHPNGVPLPSREDLAATENIVRALGLVKIRLRDHIILAENDYFSLRDPAACLSDLRPAQCYAHMEENDLHYKIIVV